MIYLDYASTSYPKPACVMEGIIHYSVNVGVNPGRGGSVRAKEADKIIKETRQLLAKIMGVKDYAQISFTHNATHASNIAIKGLLKKRDHVVITNLEHNAVIRPIYKLHKERVIEFDIWKADKNGVFEIATLEKLIKNNTRLIVINHGSNVIGSVSPIKQISNVVKKHNVLLMVDVSQTAGLIPINADENQIDIICGTGHKSLLGPPGVGFLYIRDSDFRIDSLYEGGSGYDSLSHEQPVLSPAKFEAGTLNYLGVAGLNASLKYVMNKKDTYQQQMYLVDILQRKLLLNEHIKLYNKDIFHASRLPIILFNIKGMLPVQVEHFLDKNDSIIVRSGLHCAPLIHKTLKTIPNGAVRVSLGEGNSEQDVAALAKSLNKIKSKSVAMC